MKVALIYSFEESSWFSCTIINKNLRLAYQAEFGEENILNINFTRDGKVSDKDLNLIVEQNVEKLIFIDHLPTPLNFLKRLKTIQEGISNQREYIIHVFGDYPLYLEEWREVHLLLEKKILKYVCASRKQKKLIEKFIPQEECIYVSPFPVNGEIFNANEVGEKIYEDLGIKKTDKIILYTGRISYQKRIKESLEIFFQCLSEKLISVETKFLIAGEFDKLGSLYLGYSQLQGEYFRDIEKVLIKYKEYEKNVIFLGNIENTQLVDIYKISDLYFSLSTYHDEDFGMSVAEALMCGVPAVLTDWAGYSSFKLSNDAVKLIDVKLGKYAPIINLESAKSSLVDMLKADHDRDKISNLANEYLELKSCGSNLRKIVKSHIEPFEGGSSLMSFLINEKSIRGFEFLRLETNREYNSSYFKVYDVYAE